MKFVSLLRVIGTLLTMGAFILQGIALLQAMIYSPFVMTLVCFVAGILYVAYSAGQLGLLEHAATLALARAQQVRF